MWKRGVNLIENVWIVLFLMVCTVTDIKERHVYMYFCIVNGIGLWIYGLLWMHMEIPDMIIGIVPAIILEISYILNRESVGQGDVLILVITGSVIGITRMTETLLWALMLCVIVGLAIKIFRGATFKTQIPFVPFILIGYLITYVIGG